VGRLFPNMTSKILDLDDVEVSTGQPGEIYFKGPNVFKCHLNNPEGTAKSFTKDGYYRTGHTNMLMQRATSTLRIFWKGSSSTRISRGARRTGRTLENHPKVYGVAVIGIYDAEDATEVPRAYIVTAPGVTRGQETERNHPLVGGTSSGPQATQRWHLICR
jgi:4-coumarate--CoA ligase